MWERETEALDLYVHLEANVVHYSDAMCTHTGSYQNHKEIVAAWM